MIAAVFDTNVLVAGIFGVTKLESVPGELWRRWRANVFQLVISEPILDELAGVLTNSYFTRRLTPAEIEDSLVRLHRRGYHQPITIQVRGIAAHPEDDLIIATAVSAQAPYLVTGDKSLLRRGSFQGTRLLTPRQFLTILDNDVDA